MQSSHRYVAPGSRPFPSASSAERQNGFTLIELMLVIAIVGILAGTAIPAYETYQKRSRFVEVVSAAARYKAPIEVAIQTGRASALEDLDAGTLGIPAGVLSGQSTAEALDSIAVEDGVITATGTDKVNRAVYRLGATLLPSGGVRWVPDTSVANACQNTGIC